MFQLPNLFRDISGKMTRSGPNVDSILSSYIPACNFVPNGFQTLGLEGVRGAIVLWEPLIYRIEVRNDGVGDRAPRTRIV